MSTVAVAPTETVLLTLDVSTRRGVSVQVVNLDEWQIFTGTIYARNRYESVWAPTTLADFGAINPGDSVVAIVPCDGVADLELRGFMSGTGGDVRATWS